MQVKKFEAPTMAEALKLVKTELGPEAIILSTKNHRKGFGLLSKASVEVTAAVADKSMAKKSLTEKAVTPAIKDQIEKLSASKQSAIYNEFTDYYTRRHRENRPSVQASVDAAPQPARSAVLGAPIRTPLGSQPLNPALQKTSSPPRYIDIGDDDHEHEAQSTPAYGRNGRLEREIHADSQSERIAVERAQPTRVEREAVMGQDVVALQEDIQRLKMMLEEIKSEQLAITDAKITESSSDEVQVEFNNLLRNGVDKRYATALTKQVTFTLSREALQSSDRIIEALAVEMMNSMKVDHPLEIKPGGERRVYALVGPTGVGKTTTIAKLASQAILQKNLRVGLINVDSYKVAALDQLATYAKILNVPFRQASTALELDRALQEFKPLDLVLIDTSGRSQRDSESLTQMKALLSENAAIRPILIMSATTRDSELYDIITRFKLFNPTGLIFSKLDESATFGCIYNVAVKTGLPLTYFTVGQRVPEDIEPASRERVADLILDL